ncbi:SH3 domain-containing protein [Cribrihabitans neustonicus]|uniref:SH3 domain-containing protein n=1 Tax=Cribrihabitans neustonicus TaxID=1429085 RepID=UPI003B5C13BD
MPRLVIASFLILGWTFYEMSGGADFEPRKGPSAAVDIAKTAFSHDPAPAPVRRTAVDADSLVTRVALNETTPVRPAADPELRSQVARRQIAAAGPAIARSGTAFPPAGGQQAVVQLASLDAGLAGLQPVKAAAPAADAALQAQPEPQAVSVEQTDAAPAEDVRQITATRVNMRLGPGTNYPVLTQLDRGDEVVVFEDDGSGWLHLRVPSRGRVGWIAASLVSD